MRLFITTQAVDPADPTLGFFCRWLEEFSKHCDVVVVCLRKGEHNLPPNVEVRVLPQDRVRRALALLRIAAAEQYDGVFVHMNPEYLVVAGWFWKVMGTKVALWYTHKHVDLKLRIATLFADKIFTASKESFRLRSGKVEVMGHGIDTDTFKPDLSVVREGWWLSVGRLDKTKRHDIVIQEAADAGMELRIAGEGPERKNLEALAQKLGTQVMFLGGLPHAQMPDVFRRAGLFRHASETGSLDKVLLEAIACGCPVRTNNLDLKALESESPEGIVAHHSLPNLISRILAWYA